jgi:malonate decarboxylase gamma subunit
LWEGDLSDCLKNAMEGTDIKDIRRANGLARGGRKLAEPVVQRVLASA